MIYTPVSKRKNSLSVLRLTNYEYCREVLEFQLKKLRLRKICRLATHAFLCWRWPCQSIMHPIILHCSKGIHHFFVCPSINSEIYKFQLHRAQLLNFRARSIPQSATASNQLSSQPYTKAGMLGDGQIVTIADTGIDVFSCYFYDPDGQVKPSLPNAPMFDQNRRKVIGYIYNSCGDQTDTDGGHGTHVAGTVAGSILKADIGGGNMTN